MGRPQISRVFGFLFDGEGASLGNEIFFERLMLPASAVATTANEGGRKERSCYRLIFFIKIYNNNESVKRITPNYVALDKQY